MYKVKSPTREKICQDRQEVLDVMYNMLMLELPLGDMLIEISAIEGQFVIIEPGPRRELPVFGILVEIENSIPVRVTKVQDSLIWDSESQEKFSIFKLDGEEFPPWLNTPTTT